MPTLDDWIAELQAELRACSATPAGYREAAVLRAKIIHLQGCAS